MKTIGFIDYFIDEWHANNYPKMIRESSQADRFQLALAWEECTPEGKKGLADWCRDFNVGKADNIEQVIEECDCLVVLSPDNPERHEDLADLPLRSGKPVYIDKTFAPTRAAAERLFAKAEQHGTPLMSSSALRFGSQLQEVLHGKLDGEKVNFVSSTGPGRFDNYAIHQLEMLVMTLGRGATRVMQCGVPSGPVMLIDYADSRRGIIQQGAGQTFRLVAQYGDNQAVVVDQMGDFFVKFIESLLGFLDSGKPPVPKEDTLEIISLVEAGTKALESPDTWVPVPGGGK